MIQFILSIFLCNLILSYFYFIGNIFEKFIKLKIQPAFKIIIGFSFFILISYYLYFTLRLETKFINIFFLISFAFLFFFFKSYLIIFFQNREIIILNLILIIFLIISQIFGEQFYIFRGNYWDSSNYLSSALLFKTNNYDIMLEQNYSSVFKEFNNMDSIVTGRPIINYILSLFLNFNYSIFYVYYLFKCFFLGLNFLIFSFFLKEMFKEINAFQTLVLSSAFIFSFWNLYVFEIDALSHYASISILILLIYQIFILFQNLNSKKNYFLTIILTSSLFIIYPEIIFIPFMIFLSLTIYYFKNFDKKIFLYFIISFFIFCFLTAPSLETNFKYLFTSQLNQATKQSDWWGYFGGFLLGKENLVLNQNFVNELKLLISNSSLSDVIKKIHTEHFSNNYYFIYLNIFPSLSGLYFLLPGKVENSIEVLFYILLILSLNFYLLLILFKNLNTLISINKLRNKFFLILIPFIFITIFLFFKNSFWTLIKFYTYLFPFLFIFFAINFKTYKINKIYIILASLFFLYKFSVFNDGIGRYDSFPSIINPYLKKEIIWNDTSYKKLENCESILFDKNNYILKTYINLKMIDLNQNNEKKRTCKIELKNKKFIISYD